MAQKKKAEEVKAPPVISKLPIPISDSPLVIDLPDGQKLVVGRMIQGSVIEVATWRGTGRPDSRTSRLMLGMSIGDVNPTPEQRAAEAEANGGQAAPAQRSSQLSNPYLAKVQEFIWAVVSHPIMKKLFGKPEPKQPKAPKLSAAPVTSEASPATELPSSAPAEPISPFTQGAGSGQIKKSRKSSAGFMQKLFGSPKSKKKVKVSKAAGSSSWTSSTSSTVPTTSGDDIDAWLEEISSKAKARVESKIAPSKSAASPATSAKKSVASGKTTKKATSVSKKRK